MKKKMSFWPGLIDFAIEEGEQLMPEAVDALAGFDSNLEGAHLDDEGATAEV